MDLSLLHLLRCPVTRSGLQIQVISKSRKQFQGKEREIIHEGILFAERDWFYPVINGVPRLIVEAFEDYADFFETHLHDYKIRINTLKQNYTELISYVVNKNRRTKESFSQEWNVFDHRSDKTWNEDREGMLKRFLNEIDEPENALEGKIIFDAGCGNGILDQLLSEKKAIAIGMDFSLSVEKAFQINEQPSAFFIQGDVQFPPVQFKYFDIVHCSGVLHHTNNTEVSFSKLEPCVKPGGKFSVWLYHSRRNVLHNGFNFLRKFTSKLNLRFQYLLYSLTILPVGLLVNKVKGRKKNRRETMIDILDWLSPEFRWEHSHEEVIGWFKKYHYSSIKITTSDTFGFNITGRKKTHDGSWDI